MKKQWINVIGTGALASAIAGAGAVFPDSDDRAIRKAIFGPGLQPVKPARPVSFMPANKPLIQAWPFCHRLRVTHPRSLTDGLQ